MAVYCIINGKQIPVRSFSMRETQKEIGTFDVEIPVKEIVGQDVYLQDISLYDDGFLIVDGFIRTTRSYPRFNQFVSTPSFTRLKCDNNLGRLECEASVEVHFQNTLASLAINFLLSNTTLWNWQISDTSTLIDTEITLDLRSKETIWTQIQDILTNLPNPTYIRYNSYDSVSNTYFLDIGSFGRQVNDYYAVWGDNILSPPTFKEPTEEPIGNLYPISGSSPEQPVNLDLALNIDPTLSDASQDYQIIVGQGRIQNNLFNGCSKRKTYNNIKTENEEEPTQAEKNQVAMALYKKAIRDMQQSEPYLSLDIKISSLVKPLIHEKMFFKGQIFEEDYDIYTGETNLVQSFNVEDWMRITEITLDFRERTVEYNPFTEKIVPSYVYQIGLTSRDDIDNYNTDEIILNKTNESEQYDNSSGVVATEIGFLGSTTVTIQQDTVASNCTTAGIDGRIFNFPAPVTPAGANAALVTITAISDVTALYTITQFGGIGTNHILCVTGSGGGNWDLTDDITISITWVFLKQ